MRFEWEERKRWSPANAALCSICFIHDLRLTHAHNVRNPRSVEPEQGFIMADGTVFHSQEDEDKMRQHKTKLAKQNANAR